MMICNTKIQTGSPPTISSLNDSHSQDEAHSDLQHNHHHTFQQMVFSVDGKDLEFPQGTQFLQILEDGTVVNYELPTTTAEGPNHADAVVVEGSEPEISQSSAAAAGGYHLFSIPESVSSMIASSISSSSNNGVLSHNRNAATVSNGKIGENLPKLNPNQGVSSSSKCISKTQEEALLKRQSRKRNGFINDPTLTVQISENESVNLHKFYFQSSLCRICLLEKEVTISLFENVTIDDKGVIENSKGPKAVRYNILPALKTLLDVQVEVGDGLPNRICTQCMDKLIEFSAFRMGIAISQRKLRDIVEQVKNTSHPTFIPEIGESDFRNTDMFKHPELILGAKQMLNESVFCHLVRRCIPDRVWDVIFSTMSLMTGRKSVKLNSLEQYICSSPYVTGWFCFNCNITVLDNAFDAPSNHYQTVHGIDSVAEILYPCDICGNSYPLSDVNGSDLSYASHWIQHFYFHECGVCFKRFPSHRSLAVHTKSIHEVVSKDFTCEICDKPFGTKKNLESHKKTHLSPADRMPFLNICPVCGKGLTGSLQAHIDTVHSDKRPFKCDVCGKTFKSRESVTNHRTLVHLNIKKHQCDICGLLFKTHSSKAVHILRHTGKKPHECSTCGKSFYSIPALKSHTLIHKDVGDFKCLECGKCFKRKRYLDEHMTLHSGEKPHECPECGKLIRMRSNFYKHLKVHQRQKAPEDSAEPLLAIKQVECSSVTVEVGLQNIEVETTHEISST